VSRRTGIEKFVEDRRGVALLIVLLVTALLIALIFEFSYATRISLNSAVNFRDSERAYYLARAGVGAFAKYGEQLRKSIPPGEFAPVPGIEEQIMIKWEDQRALINLNTSPDWVENLFSNYRISIDTVKKIEELKKERGKFQFVSELHAVMADEDYAKVAQFLTVDSDGKINLNTASQDVLNSILPDKPQTVSTIINTRKEGKTIAGWQDIPGLDTNTVGAIVSSLVGNSTYFRVYSYATVGGYTKQVEAVFQDTNPTFLKAL
jgi:type II secretory pathway component PulK